MEEPVSAFADDALGRHDAVGLVGAIQRREVSVVEVVDAAIARTERVADRLGAMACPDYDTARRLARDPHGGYFAGVRSQCLRQSFGRPRTLSPLHADSMPVASKRMIAS